MTATTIYCIIVRLYIIAIAADSQRRLTTTIAYILTPTDYSIDCCYWQRAANCDGKGLRPIGSYDRYEWVVLAHNWLCCT